MGSDRRYFLAFGAGIYIVNDRRFMDQAYCLKGQYEYPDNIGPAEKDGNKLYFSGGGKKNFKAVKIEIYGIV